MAYKNKEDMDSCVASHKDQLKSYQQNYHKNQKDRPRQCAVCSKEITKYQVYCTECRAIRDKQRMREYHLLKKFRLTSEQYEDLLKAQDYKCPLCLIPLDLNDKGKGGLRPCVDHDHNTGEVRGILHHTCNRHLATVEDLDFVDRALKYLGRP